MNINVIKMMIMTAINFVSQKNTSTKNTLCCNEFVLLLVTLEKLADVKRQCEDPPHPETQDINHTDDYTNIYEGGVDEVRVRDSLQR